MPRLAVLVALALTSATLHPPAQAVESPAASAAPKPAARVTVTMAGPQGVKGQVSLRGRGGRTVFKAPARKRAKVVVPLRAGSFRVVAPDLVVRGRLYEPVISRTTIKVKKVRKGKKAAKVALKVVWKPVARTGDLLATGATTRSIDLKWAGVGKTFEVRRATGEKAPATRKAGKRVHLGRKRALTDKGLAEGGRYAYSLWTKKGKKWVGPTTLVAGTVKGELGAEYALAPGAVVVDTGDKDKVQVTDRGVWVTLAAGRPTPPVGSGIVLPVSAALPAGAIGKVAEVSPDGRRVLVVSGVLADAFDLFRIDADYSTSVKIPDLQVGSADPDTEPGVELGTPAPAPGTGTETLRRARASKVAKATEGATAARATGSSRAIAPLTAPADVAAISAEDAKSQESCLSYGTFVNLSMHDWSATADGNFRLDFHRHRVNTRWGSFEAPAHAMVGDAWFEVGFDVQMDAVVAKELSCFIGRDFPVNIPTYPAPLTVQFEGGLAVAVGGEVGVKDIAVGATLSGKGAVAVGVGVDDGVSGSASVDGRFNGGTGMAKASGEFGPALGVVVGFGSIAGSGEETSAGAVAGFTGDLWAPKIGLEGEWGGEGQENCTTFTGTIEGSIGLKAEAWLGPAKVGSNLTLAEGTLKELFEANWPYGCATDEELGDGDVRATLRWGSNPDYDLHVTDPSGETVYYGNPTSASGGELDHDWIPGCGNTQQTQSWVENVNWATGEAPPGTYGVRVVEFNGCGLVGQEWTLRVYVKGREVVSQSGSGTSPVFEFTVP
ncbi:YfaP family protein [Nocardioides daphniae]|uniref:Fibronectin type III domain-containing protein n=3 Tax=Nocardioides daphniae TaxID=402297 RepID=A0A4P7UF18_9ACTN|nr:hypothetical protein [Nocardioides daphniae]QCC78131.1 hypothetical protein E2C04_14770 [Nocardioides daphniae]